MKAPSIIIHAGRAKTATTFIQHVLAFNREILLANGILYPYAGSSDGISHEQLAQALRATGSSNSVHSNSKANDIFAKLSIEIEQSKSELVLISSEIF